MQKQNIEQTSKSESAQTKYANFEEFEGDSLELIIIRARNFDNLKRRRIEIEEREREEKNAIYMHLYSYKGLAVADLTPF